MTSSNGMSHQRRSDKTKDEWLTPPWLLERLGEFDLDPCAPIAAPWATAAHHYTIDDNGLIKPWFGRVWLNPPYGRAVGRWMGRMAEHGEGTALIFARTDTDAFHDHVWEQAHALLFLHGRLHFHHRDGTRATANAGAPSVLVAYGQNDAEILAETGIDGKFVPLLLPRLVAVVGMEAMSSEPSWRDLVTDLMREHEGPISLDHLYRLVAGHPKTRNNRHWREKVRQALQRGPFERVDTGIWQQEGAAA